MAGNSDDDSGEENVLVTSTASTLKMVLEADSFVDKSMLIYALFGRENSPKVMITAPRRFGKSLNMDMMKCFLEFEVDDHGKEKTEEEKYNYKLFTSTKNGELAIMKENVVVRKHFGKYPIIQASFFTSDKIDSMDKALDVCRKAVCAAFQQHNYLYEQEHPQITEREREKCRGWCDYPENKLHGDVVTGLKDLSKYLRKFHKNKKVFVLIDEFDSVIQSAMFHVKDKQDREDAMLITISVIGAVVKDNEENLAGCLITGILDTKGSGISNILGNVQRSRFGSNTLGMKFYGFRKSEVDVLFEKWQVSEDLKAKAHDHYNNYYDTNGKSIYNPYAIVLFLGSSVHRRNDLPNFWQRSGYIVGLREIFQNPHFITTFTDLLQGRTANHDVSFDFTMDCLLGLMEGSTDIDTVLAFLFYQGYLSYLGNDEVGNIRSVVIPNDALKHEIKREMIGRVRDKLNVEYLESSGASLSKIADLCESPDFVHFSQELQTFQGCFERLLQSATSLLKPLNKATLKTIVTVVCLEAKFSVGNEALGTDGNPCDVIAYTDKFGAVFELKCERESSKDALKQIFESRYFAVFTNPKYYFGKENPSLMLLLGLHVNKVQHVSICFLRKREIMNILNELNIDKSKQFEERIEIALAISLIKNKKVVNAERRDKFVAGSTQV